MPRRPRVVLPGLPLHLIQRSNKRQPCFYTDDDYRYFLEWLHVYAKKSDCQLHAYVLMTNQVHLLLTPSTLRSAGELMKRLGQRYVQYFNRTYSRTGALWEGRFRSCPTQEASYVLGCYRYIELKPVRAGMADHPADYKWSSYRANAQGETELGVNPHECYLDLGVDDEVRQAAYRELCRYELDPGMVDEIREATNGNYVLGSPPFKKQVANALEQRVVRGRPGRPKKYDGTTTQDLL